MPRKAAHASVADEHAAPGGAAAVDRALSLLMAFDSAQPMLSLADLAARTRLHKSTALRLLASLEHAGLVQRLADGRYAAGAAAIRLHAAHAAAFSLEAVVMPVLRQLAAHTRESAAFHVRQNDARLCLYRVDSPQPIRDHIRAGDVLPLKRGAGGRVLSAYARLASGALPNDAISKRIRLDGVIGLADDRSEGVAGISSPVFDAAGELAGALTLTMPTQRYTEAHAAPVRHAAVALTKQLGGRFPG
jgi:DNA-binding IclR family transcriptional regulator